MDPADASSRPWQAFDLVPLGVLVVDAHGRIAYTNQALREKWGKRLDPAMPAPEQLVAYNMRDADGRAVSADDSPLVRAMAGEPAEGIFYRMEGPLRLWTPAIATPTVDRGGTVTGAVVVFVDVSEQQEEHRTTEAILDQIPTSVVVFGADGRVTRANRSAERIIRALDGSRPIGDTLRDIPIVDAETGAALDPGSNPVDRALRGENVPVYRIAVSPATGGGTRHFSGSAQPLHEPDGSVSGAIVLVRDVTDQVERRRDEREREVRERILAPLTPRERSILDGVAAGYSNRDIASRMGISYSTVRTHVRAVLMKIGAHTRLEAAAKARGRPERD